VRPALSLRQLQAGAPALTPFLGDLSVKFQRLGFRHTSMHSMVIGRTQAPESPCHDGACGKISLRCCSSGRPFDLHHVCRAMRVKDIHHLAVPHFIQSKRGLVGERITHEQGQVVIEPRQTGAVCRQRLFAAGVCARISSKNQFVVHWFDAAIRIIPALAKCESQRS